MSFQTTESKKEEFRKYLEKTGVIDQLTRVLVGLYEEPEKPQNAIDFIKKYLGSPTDIDVEKLKLEYEKLKDENTRLKKTMLELEKEIETLKPSDDQQEERSHLCCKYSGRRQTTAVVFLSSIRSIFSLSPLLYMCNRLNSCSFFASRFRF
eukprot:TRINITY_DN638_c0_g1_i14.p1 TRINITY_DN638_c0_g1~~TRINITY_DN638_c0_g1_i14.p1  ORF type:complete len:151 (+),score=46.26 TRINITY_DN638_c0_g1_i14:138-590(+)